MKEISDELYEQLDYLGIIPNETRAKNIGASNYSEHTIQPYSIWIDWDLNPWDADIIKRVLRTKQGDSRKMDYEKIIHICQERIRQIDVKEKYKIDKFDVINLKKGDIVSCVKSYTIDDGDRMIECFTECWTYMVQKDGSLITNQGNRIQPNNEFFNEHFIKINE